MRPARALLLAGLLLAGFASDAAARPAYVLAISWQPAFCEASPRKPECRNQDPAEATRFSLHGLWPQPRSRVYCGVAPAVRQASEEGRWRDIPPPPVTAATRRALAIAMPGTRSFLDRHEWAKHGSCHAGDAEAYFRDSLNLLAAVNASPVAALMRARIGQSVTADDIRASFDAAFGPGAGERVRIACRDDGARRLVTELTIGLSGDVPGGASLAELIAAAPVTRPGCPAGEVDALGLQ